jgi:hypothetical protein
MKMAALTAMAVIPLAACSVSTPAGVQAVKVKDSYVLPVSPTVEGCMAPEQNELQYPGNVFKTFNYPSRQISWDANEDKNAEAPSTVVVSNAEAPAELKVPVTVTFDLTKDCEKLKQFHRDFGTKYQGQLDENGNITQGWINLVNYVIGQPLRNTLVSIAQKYSWRQIWNDEKVRAEFQQALTDTLPKVSKERTNNVEYFTNFQVTVMKPDPVDATLKQAIIAEQQAVAQAAATKAKGVADAQAAQAKADADVKAAVAQTEVARQQALQKQAEIAGFPSVDAYLRQKEIDVKEEAVNRNINPWPSPIVAGLPH